MARILVADASKNRSTTEISEAVAAPAPRSTYLLGGWSALIAGLLFRRNLAAEVSAFVGGDMPKSAEGWFRLLGTDRLLGLTLLNAFDVVNYLLVGAMMYALYHVVRRGRAELTGLGAGAAWLGIGVFIATSPALSMLALSERFADAPPAQRPSLVAAGESALALGRFTGGPHPGTAGYVSLALVALGSLLLASLMWRDRVFGRGTAGVGMVAAALDLAYCSAYVLMPRVDAGSLALAFIPAAGLCWMLWHVLVGWRLLKLGREAARVERGDADGRDA